MSQISSISIASISCILDGLIKPGYPEETFSSLRVGGNLISIDVTARLYFIQKKGVLDGLVTINYNFEECTLALENPSGSFCHGFAVCVFIVFPLCSN